MIIDYFSIMFVFFALFLSEMNFSSTSQSKDIPSKLASKVFSNIGALIRFSLAKRVVLVKTYLR